MMARVRQHFSQRNLWAVLAWTVMAALAAMIFIPPASAAPADLAGRAGPATGKLHEAAKREFGETITKLLRERG